MCAKTRWIKDLLRVIPIDHHGRVFIKSALRASSNSKQKGCKRHTPINNMIRGRATADPQNRCRTEVLCDVTCQVASCLVLRGVKFVVRPRRLPMLVLLAVFRLIELCRDRLPFIIIRFLAPLVTLGVTFKPRLLSRLLTIRRSLGVGRGVCTGMGCGCDGMSLLLSATPIRLHLLGISNYHLLGW